MLKEYDNLDIDAAVAKLKSKVAWDDEDKAFALARASYFTEGELEAILGDGYTPPEPTVVVPQPSTDGNEPSNDPTTAPVDENAPTDGTVPPTGPELVDMKMSLAQLQEKAVSLDLDSSGVKQELVDRINAFLTEPK